MSIPYAKEFIQNYPPPGKVVLSSIVGSHIYGFQLKNNIDIRGIHVTPTERLLGVNPPSGTYTCERVYQNNHLNFVSRDIGKIIHGLIKGNFSYLECIMSPAQIFETEYIKEVRLLASKSYSKLYTKHYWNFFYIQQGKAKETRSMRSTLYAFRAALSAIHFMKYQEFISDLWFLSTKYQLLKIQDFMTSRKKGVEIISGESDLKERDQLFISLCTMFKNAEESSSLPPLPQDISVFNDYLLNIRKVL
jgi:predicted nucleotidyltransferase